MNLVMQRTKYDPDGVFSTVRTDDFIQGQVMVTLEHSYDRDDPEVASSAGAYPQIQNIPKLPPGSFICQRSRHHLASMPAGDTFETFEITGIEGHAGIVFHWGNYEDDSKGCPLTGSAEAEGSHAGRAGVEMVINSKATFEKFMALQAGVDWFKLTVIA